MKKYSETQVYNNGNRVIVGPDGDASSVRKILATGIIERIVNYGALINRDTTGMTLIVSGDFELWVEHVDTSYGVDIGGTPKLTQTDNANRVYYQRISE